NVDSFLRCNHWIAIEVCRPLFKLSKVLDRLQGALRSEKALNIHAAQRRCLNTPEILLRPDIADEMEGAVSMAVDVAVDAGHALHAIIPFGLAISSRGELLLRKLSHQQRQSVELFWIENAIKQIVKVVDCDEL